MLAEITEFSGSLRERVSLPDRVQGLLRKLLVTGKLKPGDRIVETRIARDLGVGQPTVREALKSLEEQGLVIRHPNRGCVVTQMSRKEIDQVYRLRIEWEPLAIDLAMENWDPLKASALTVAAGHMLEAAKAADAEKYYKWDLEFHQALWRMAGNPYLEKALLQIVLPLFSFAMIRLAGSDTDWGGDAEEHAAIARAIEAGERETAKLACRSGLESFWKRVSPCWWKKSGSGEQRHEEVFCDGSIALDGTSSSDARSKGRLSARNPPDSFGKLLLLSRSGQGLADGRHASGYARWRFCTAKEWSADCTGNAAASLVIQRILEPDAAKRMPPEMSHKTLSDAQKDTLKRWIEQGAPWKEQWAFVAPVRPDLPATKMENWARNPIDRFVLAKLEETGAEPAPEADKRHTHSPRRARSHRLAARPAEIEAFLKDTSPSAYERMVDRYLASPHYGEHRAPLLAGRGALRRHPRHPRGQLPRDLAVSRLGDPGLQPQSAVRPVHHRTDRRRPAAQAHARPADRHRLPPLQRHHQRSRHHRRRVRRDLRQGSRRHHRRRLARNDRGLRHLPRPQVRPDFAEGFLCLGAFFRNTTQKVMDDNIPDTPPIVLVPRPEDRAAWDEDLDARWQAIQCGDGGDQEPRRRPFAEWLRERTRPSAATHPLGAERSCML